MKKNSKEVLTLSGRNLEDTVKLGEELGARARPGDVLVLIGELGAGKTTFTKAFGRGAGYEGTITSPTFTLVNEYQGPLPIYHFDTYRLEAVEDVDELGFDDYFFGEGVCIIEWGERIEPFLPEDRLRLTIEKVSEEERRFHLEATGPRSLSWMKGEEG